MHHTLQQYVTAMQDSASALQTRLPDDCTELQSRSTCILMERIDVLANALIALDKLAVADFDHDQRHHLRNIITPILSYASLLASGRTGNLPTNLTCYSQDIAQSVRDFNSALDTLRDNRHYVA